MLQVTDLPMGQEPEVGQVYLVPCVNLAVVPQHELHTVFHKHQDKLVALPVLGYNHSDPEFRTSGGELPHYHLDIRFVTDFEFEEVWQSSAKRANSTSPINFPIIPTITMMETPTTFLHPKLCFRQLSDFRTMFIGLGYDYSDFEDKMEKHTLNLENPVCPHHGTSLKGQCVRDGVVTCPLHGSTWCATTGKYVRKTPNTKPILYEPVVSCDIEVTRKWADHDS